MDLYEDSLNVPIDMLDEDPEIMEVTQKRRSRRKRFWEQLFVDIY